MSVKTLTVKTASEKFTAYLEELGKTPSTVGTARRTLDLLIEHWGEGKQVAKILPVHVGQFYASEIATMLRGKPRAKPSVLQIRRIVRQFLVWCHEQGYVAKLPVPKDEAEHGGGVRVPGGDTPRGSQLPALVPNADPAE